MTVTECIVPEPGVFQVAATARQHKAARIPDCDLDFAVSDVLDLDGLVAHYRQHGYVILRGLFSDALMDQIDVECTQAQRDVLAGILDPRHGSTRFLDDEGKVERFVNYVEHVEDLSPAVKTAATAPVMTAVLRHLLGPRIWLNRNKHDGVVYQDARPGRESGYTRIGWHSDWQSGPSLDIWPSAAFTIHIDATSPANGFLRVVPGSHLWATPAPYRNVNDAQVPPDARPAAGYTDVPPPFDMPLGFGKVPGEIAVYAERGDTLLHDAYLWHSAARASDDDTMRRHVRGGYFAGTPTDRYQFVKNAAR